MARRLIALDIAGGPPFVAALQRAWDDGDAVVPIDVRIPRHAAVRLMATLEATHVIGADGEVVALSGGTPVCDGDALVVATSGTTGEPKGVVLTHDAVRASAIATSERIGVEPGRDHWLACLPVAHVGGLSVITRAIITGTRLTLLPGFDADAVDASPATLVSLVHTAFRRIDRRRWRAIVLGGSATPGGLGDNVVRTYGLTETGSGLVYEGRPLNGVDVRVDESSQVHVRGPMLLRAYRRAGDPIGTDPRDTEGWFATGDGGSFVDGVLEVKGRLGDVIVSGAEKVWPDTVELVLSRVPGVAEVAVVGRPDPEWGERVVAFVVPAGAEPPSLDTLRNAVKSELGPWAAPRELVVVSALPRTALGKLQRGHLR